MVTDVRLTVAKPWAEVTLVGELDQDGTRLLRDVIASARLLGCLRIVVHVEGVDRNDDPRLHRLVTELWRSCPGGAASLQVVAAGAADRASASP